MSWRKALTLGMPWKVLSDNQYITPLEDVILEHLKSV